MRRPAGKGACFRARAQELGRSRLPATMPRLRHGRAETAGSAADRRTALPIRLHCVSWQERAGSAAARRAAQTVGERSRPRQSRRPQRLLRRLSTSSTRRSRWRIPATRSARAFSTRSKKSSEAKLERQRPSRVARPEPSLAANRKMRDGARHEAAAEAPDDEPNGPVIVTRPRPNCRRCAQWAAEPQIENDASLMRGSHAQFRQQSRCAVVISAAPFCCNAAGGMFACQNYFA